MQMDLFKNVIRDKAVDKFEELLQQEEAKGNLDQTELEIR